MSNSETDNDDSSQVNMHDQYQVLERIKQQQSFSMAVFGGLLAAACSAIVWAVVTVIIEYQIGWMAIGLGLCVGLSVRFFGRGLGRHYAYLGAALSLLGCVAGNVLSLIGFIAQNEKIGYFIALHQVRLSYLVEVFPKTVQPMDFLFYAIAVYEGYRFSEIRSITSGTEDAAVSETAPNVSFLRSRKALLIGGYSLFTVFMYATTFFASGFVTYYSDDGVKVSEGYYKNGKYQDLWTFFHPNGQIASTQYYKKGKVDSLCTWFDENGKLIKRGMYKCGLFHGKWETFYADSINKISDEGNYQNDRQQGKWVYWFPDGTKYKECFYNRDLLDSLYTEWHPNGNKYVEGFYEKNCRNGRWVQWDSSGRTVEELDYTNDTVHIITCYSNTGACCVKEGDGIYVSFHPNGQMSYSGQVKNGIRTGIWKAWYANGKIKEEILWDNHVPKMISCWTEDEKQQVTNGNGEYIARHENDTIAAQGSYKDSLQNGHWQYWYDTGEKFWTVMYRNGQQHGELKYYYISGGISSAGYMKNGKQVGDWEWYHENGQLSSKVSYSEGLKEGRQGFYDDDGIKIKEEHYKKGELQKEKILL